MRVRGVPRGGRATRRCGAAKLVSVTCPAGAVASTPSWVGTCLNPDDSKTYLIAYRDCCGKPACGQCHCDNEDRDTQLYVPQTNNDIIWCFGLDNMQYHCSTAALVGEVQ